MRPPVPKPAQPIRAPAPPRPPRELNIDDLTEADHEAALKAMGQGRRGIALAIRKAKEAAPGPAWRPAASAPQGGVTILVAWRDAPGQPVMRALFQGCWRGLVVDPSDLGTSRAVEIVIPFTHWSPLPEFRS